VREIRGVLELIGKISGELQSGGTKVQVAVAVGSESWMEGFRHYLDMVADGYDDEDERRR
jgi:hypothetical protein